VSCWRFVIEECRNCVVALPECSTPLIPKLVPSHSLTHSLTHSPTHPLLHVLSLPLSLMRARRYIIYIHHISRQHIHLLLLEDRMKQTMVPAPKDTNFNLFHQFRLVSFTLSALRMAHYQWTYIWSCVIMLFGHRMLVCTQITHIYNLAVMFTC
jgi:hypothetical protein